VNVRLSKVVFSSDKNSRGQLILASSGGKAILSPSRGYTNSTPSGGGSFIQRLRKNTKRGELTLSARRLESSSRTPLTALGERGLHPHGKLSYKFKGLIFNSRSTQKFALLFDQRVALQKVGCISGRIAIRSPSPIGCRSAPDVRRAPRRKHRRPSKRKSSSCAGRCRQTGRVPSALTRFETLCVNTAVSRFPRVGPSIAFLSVRARR
jgi:hypothetical protein